MSNFQCATNMHSVFSGLQQILGTGWQGSWDPLGPELGPIWVPGPAWLMMRDAFVGVMHDLATLRRI